MKKLLHIAGYLALGVFLLAGLLAGFTQTQFFRDRIRDAALATLDSLLVADLYIGPIYGNLVTGFSIDSIAVAVGGREMLTARRATVRYSLPGLLMGRLSVDRLILVHPLIRIENHPGAPWNFSGLMRRDTPDTLESTGPFSLPSIELGGLEIYNGTFVLRDSAALADSAHGPREPGSLEYHDLRLTNLQLSLEASMGGREAALSVRNLSCVSAASAFVLRKLSGTFHISPDGAFVEDLEIRTEKSSLSLTASLFGLDLLDGVSLEKLSDRPVALELDAHDLNFADMKFFLPVLSFLQGPVTLNIEARGLYADLTVERLAMQVGGSRLTLRGRVANLDDPGDLFLDLQSSGMVISEGDPAALLPEFGLEPLALFGESDIELSFLGRPLDFSTRLAIRSSAGTLRSDSLHLVIGGQPVLRYTGRIVMEDVDLAVATGDASLGSRLTGNVQIDGEGVDLRALRGSLRVQLDRSEFRGLRIGPSRFVVEAFANRIGAFAGVSLENMQAMLSGELDIREDLPPFTINGNITSVNLAPLLGDARYDSDITAVLNVHGRGVSPDSMSLDALLDLTSTRYGNYTLDSGVVRCRMEQLGGGARRLQVESRLADLLLEGRFDLEYIGAILAHRTAVIGSEIIRRLEPWTHKGREESPSADLEDMERTLAYGRVPINTRFDVTIKDLEPVSVVAGERAFNGRGTLTGTITGDHTDLSLSARLDAREFFYGNVESGILLQNASVDLSVDHLTLEEPLRSSSIYLDAVAGKVHVSDARLDSVRAVVSLDRTLVGFDLAGTYNESLYGAVSGTGTLTSDSLDLLLRSLSLGPRGFVWTADPGAHLFVAGGTSSVNALVLRRGAEEMTVRAAITAGGNVEGALRADRIELEDFKYFLSEEELGVSGSAFGGTGRLTLEAGGTVENPVYSASFRGDRLVFREVPIGNLEAEFSYSDSLLRVRIEIQDTSRGAIDSPILRADGSLPVNLALSGVRDRISERPVDMTVESRGLPIAVFDPLLPTINEMTGLIECDLRVIGTLRKPEYSGTFSIPRSSFLFVPNNITYTLAGTFATEGERIRVVEAVVSNVPGDEKGNRLGSVTITGDFALKNLTPGEFNLQARGALLVVKESTRSSDLSVYGSLFAEIAGGGLRFTGEIGNSLLKGDLLIRNSMLVFPPTEEPARERLQVTVPVTVIDDTTRRIDPRTRSAEARYFFSSAGMARATGHDLSRVSFMDGLRYDLDIETSGGNTQIKMIFNPLSGEELEATIDGRFSITGDGKRWFGDLSIERAYYNFLKRFNAEGTLRYRGDFADPLLDIQASYDGVRVVQDSVTQREEKVIVTFVIGGTRMKPTMQYRMSIDGVDYAQYRGPKSNDLQSDAIQFVVYGSFPLSAAERGDVPNDVRDKLGLSVLTGAASLLTGALSEFLRDQTGFINSVELSYGSRILGSSPDIRLSGTAWNGYWRYGGRLFDDPLNTANFSLIYSLDAVFGAPSLRNLMVELERRVETNPLGQKSDLKRVNSARVYYRFSF